MKNLSIENSTTTAPAIIIKQLPDPKENECNINITMDWSTAHLLRENIAPFLSQFCRGIDCRMEYEKHQAVVNSNREALKKRKITEHLASKMQRYRAVYEQGTSYAQFKTMGGSQKDYYKARRRAAIWLKKKSYAPSQVARHLGMSHSSLNKMLSSVNEHNTRIWSKQALGNMSAEKLKAYYLAS